MRLLLDEMYSPRIAQELRSDGVEVVAVTTLDWVRGTDDRRLLEIAAADGRALVTENVRDFVPLAGSWAADGRRHSGIVLTPSHRFPRRDGRYPGNVINALRRFLATPPVDGDSWVWWLQ